VGLLFSFQPFEGQPSDTTHFTIHKVLVTAVQFSAMDRAALGGDSGSTDTTVNAPVAEAPGDQLLVTLAVSAPEAEQVVFAAEFGTVWLTGESASATETGTRVLTIADIYVTVARK
jgi:pilus assembly protein CpaB